MRRAVLILLFTCACIKIQAQVNIITTICGTDTAGYNEDGILAKNAELYAPNRICLDNLGNIYISDAFNQRIRKISKSTGIITTIAGDGTADFGGDGGDATNAKLYVPEGVAIDTSGNVYIADAGNNRIRKVDAITGIITTIAGSGAVGGYLSGGYGGDNGLATNAQLNNPSGVSIDKFSNIYIADNANNIVRRVDGGTGIITRFAGKQVADYTNGFIGYSGDGGQATNAVFSGAIQVFADNHNNVFVCDQWNHAVRKVSVSTGIITTVAGKGIAGYSGNNDLATNAELNQPGGIFVDEYETFIIAEYGNGVIRKVDGGTGIITTIVGTGIRGFYGDGGPATNALLKCTDVTIDKYGTLFIADQDNSRIRMVRDTTLRVAVPNVKQQAVSIFPNPAHNELTIEDAEGGNVSIYNLLGQQVYSVLDISDKERLDIEHLSPGVYIVHLINKEGFNQQLRLLKE